MSIKVSTKVWRHSRNKSGNLLVLLALADHANDQGYAYPGIPLLAREARMTQRHTRRCLNELVTSGELDVLPKQAPSGRTLYRIRLDQLPPHNLPDGTRTSDNRTPMAVSMDADDQRCASPYIEEPSAESSGEPISQFKIITSNPKNPFEKRQCHSPDAIGLLSSPKGGF
jgi:hypothetical protein